MTIKEKSVAPPRRGIRYPQVLDVYGRVLSAVMMLFGLWQWAVIIGVLSGPGGAFEAMTTPWQLGTMHFAVVDLVAAVGLWMRVPWGTVLWIYAALSEIAFHTVLIATFGSDFMLVTFHAVTLVLFGLLFFMARREGMASS